MTRRAASMVIGLATLVTGGGAAQEYLVRLDTRVQAASYPGVKLNSIPVGTVVTNPGGGQESPDGYAVTCIRGRSHCSFYRAGAVRRGGPLVTTVNMNTSSSLPKIQTRLLKVMQLNLQRSKNKALKSTDVFRKTQIFC